MASIACYDYRGELVADAVHHGPICAYTSERTPLCVGIFTRNERSEPVVLIAHAPYHGRIEITSEVQ